MNLGAPELIIVLLVILLLFGGRKLPELARSLGQAKKEFSDGQNEGHGTPQQAQAAPPVQQYVQPQAQVPPQPQVQPPLPQQPTPPASPEGPLSS